MDRTPRIVFCVQFPHTGRERGLLLYSKTPKPPPSGREATVFKTGVSKNEFHETTKVNL